MVSFRSGGCLKRKYHDAFLSGNYFPDGDGPAPGEAVTCQDIKVAHMQRADRQGGRAAAPVPVGNGQRGHQGRVPLSRGDGRGLRRAQRRAVRIAAAASRPPKIARFLSKCARCCWRATGSLIVQKPCPATVVGTSDPARVSAAAGGAQPAISSDPASTCTAALARTTIMSSGRPEMCSRTRASVGADAAAAGPGLRSTRNPAWTKSHPRRVRLTAAIMRMR
jgi:hypothetical protein